MGVWLTPVGVACYPDQVTGENIDSNATGYWARLLQPCLAASTPWATVFGNHGELAVPTCIMY